LTRRLDSATIEPELIVEALMVGAAVATGRK
jgi:hypothetical protein